MVDHDSMIIRPRLGPPDQAAAAVKARQGKAEQHSERGGFLRAIAARRQLKRMRARRAEINATRRRAKARVRGRAGPGASRLVKSSAVRGAASGLASAPGLVIGALAALGIALARSFSDRGFENAGAQLNRVLLGDLDEKARAAMDVRDRFSRDKDIPLIVANSKGVTSQILELDKQLREIRETELIGASKIIEDKDLQVQTTADILILRARAFIEDLFGDSRMEDGLNEVSDRLQAQKGGGR